MAVNVTELKKWLSVIEVLKLEITKALDGLDVKSTKKKKIDGRLVFAQKGPGKSRKVASGPLTSPVTTVKPSVRPIADFPGYFISKQGTVWTGKRNKWSKLKTSKRGTGTTFVSLRQDGESKIRSVSLLVSKTYGTPAKKRGKKPSDTVKA